VHGFNRAICGLRPTSFTDAPRADSSPLRPQRGRHKNFGEALARRRASRSISGRDVEAVAALRRGPRQQIDSLTKHVVSQLSPSASQHAPTMRVAPRLLPLSLLLTLPARVWNARTNRRRDRQAERLRGLEVDHEFKLRQGLRDRTACGVSRPASTRSTNRKGEGAAQHRPLATRQRIAIGATVEPVPPWIFSGCITKANSLMPLTTSMIWWTGAEISLSGFGETSRGQLSESQGRAMARVNGPVNELASEQYDIGRLPP
jgi:hypothetical protein